MPRAAAPIGMRKVRNAIDAAEADFRICWRILCSWKQTAQEAGPTLLDFQPRLASTLYGLSRVYNEVIAYRNFLVQNRERHSREFLSRRLQLLDIYSTALKESMVIGRSIGDAFAWPFYCKSYDMLRKHCSHPPIRHFPTGIGGRGEVEFIRHARAEGHFLLHHGITNFLRIGDVSFIDLRTWTVTALGELKSHGAMPGRVNVNLHLIANGKRNLPRLFSIPGVFVQGTLDERPTPSVEFKRRLAAQMSKMGSALARENTDHKAALFGAYYTNELSSLLREIQKARVAYARIGRGGTLAAVRPFRSRKMSSRLFTTVTAESIASSCKELPQRVADSLDKNSSENGLFVGGLTSGFNWGVLPFFWWPLDLEFLEEFYFQDVHIFSCYNPVYLYRMLRDSGFDVSKASTRNPLVSKVCGDKVLEVENFDFFIRAVHLFLMREERIAEILEGAAKVQVPGVPAKINIDMVPMM